MRKWIGCALAVAVLATVWTGSGLAAEPEKLEALFADDVIFYAEIPDTETLGERYEATGWYRIYKDERVQAFLEKPMAKLDEAMQEVKEKSKEEIGVELDLAELAELLPGRLAFAVETPFGGSFESEDDISFQIVAEVGEKKDRIVTLLEALVQAEEAEFTERKLDYKGATIHGLFAPADEEGGKAENIVNYAVSGDYLLIGRKLGGVKRLVEAMQAPPEANLPTAANYKRAREAAVEDAQVFYYVNVEQLYATLPQLTGAGAPMPLPGMPGAGGPGGGGPTGRQILQALGFADVKSVSASGVIEADGSAEQVLFLHNPAPTKGILRLLTAKATKMELPAFVPEPALYEGFRVGPTAIYQTVLEIMDGISPGLSMMAQSGLEGAKEETGVDFVNDVFGALGDRMSITLITEDEIGIDPSMLANPMMAQQMMAMQMGGMMLIGAEVKDAALLETSIDTLAQKAQDEGAPFQLVKEDHEGATLRVFRQKGGMVMPGMPVPCFAIVEKQLLFALNPERLKAALDMRQGGAGGLAAMPTTKAALERLEPGEKQSLLLAMNEGAYMRWYASFLKLMVGQQAKQMAEQKRIMKEMAAEAAAAGGEGEAAVEEFGMDEPEGLADFIDMEKWPDGAVFVDHLGVSVGEMQPVKDGVLVRSVSVPPAE